MGIEQSMCLNAYILDVRISLSSCMFFAVVVVVAIGTGKKRTANVDGLWYKKHVGLNGYARISESYEIDG